MSRTDTPISGKDVEIALLVNGAKRLGFGGIIRATFTTVNDNHDSK